MPRCTVSGRTTIAPTATLPAVSLYATAARRLKVKEVHLFNSTATSFVAALNRLTTAGTQGAGLTEVCEDDTDAVIIGTAFAGHSVAPTLGGEVRRTDVGAAVGSGMIWTFSEAGLQIPAGTANGIGILCPTATGQILDYVIVWDE